MSHCGQKLFSANNTHMLGNRKPFPSKIVTEMSQELRIKQKWVERPREALTPPLEFLWTGIEVKRPLRTEMFQIPEQLTRLFVDAVTEEPVERIGVRQQGVNGAIKDYQVTLAARSFKRATR